MKRFLVADDFPGMAETFAELLHSQWSATETIDIALDGRQALDLAMANRPCAVILDVGMPGLDGIGTAVAIRAAYPDNPPVIIAITARSLLVEKARDAAVFDHVLFKPVDLGLLVEVLNRERLSMST